MKDTVSIGDKTLAKVITRFLDHGYFVSIPWSAASPYDIIVDIGDKLLKVQVKTARIRRGCVEFALFSVNGTARKAVLYGNKVDYIAAYCPENEKFYFINIAEFNTTKAFLRLTTPKNNMVKGVRWAKHYEL